MKMIIDFPLEVDSLPDLPALAIDPGKTVGWVQLFKEDDKLRLAYGQDVWPEDAFYLQEYVDGSETVIIENFRLFPGKAKAKIGSTFPTVEVIGFVRGLMHRYNREDQLHEVQASQSALWRKHDLLKLVRGRHAKSALGVLLYHIARGG